MSSVYGTGMIHWVLHRKAFIKAKWASKLGLSGRDCEVRDWGRHPGVRMHGWSWPQEIHLTCYWLEFAVVLRMDMVCVWGIKPLGGDGRGSAFSTMTCFPSVWWKRGECDGKLWGEVLLLLSRNDKEWKSHHQKFKVQKTWTTPGNNKTWQLP